MIRAIDVSRWQGQINWDAVRGDGVQAAWIKVAGSDAGMYRDGKGATNRAGANAARVPYGTYYFFVPGAASPEQQAQHAVIHGHGDGDLWPMIDVEHNPHGWSQAAVDRAVTAFCAEVHRLTGKESIVYTYSAAGLVGYTADAPSHCRLWVANYGRNQPGATPPSFSPRVPPAWPAWDIWQFNSVTPVAGIEGHVDQNVITDEFWAAMTGTTPAPHHPSEEDDHMDTLIVDGREGRLSAWLLSGRHKTWVPNGDFAALFEAAAARGHGDVKVPPPDQGGIMQTHGSPWIGRLDLAVLTNVDETPEPLGGRAEMPDDHESGIRGLFRSVFGADEDA